MRPEYPYNGVNMPVKDPASIRRARQTVMAYFRDDIRGFCIFFCICVSISLYGRYSHHGPEPHFLLFVVLLYFIKPRFLLALADLFGRRIRYTDMRVCRIDDADRWWNLPRGKTGAWRCKLSGDNGDVFFVHIPLPGKDTYKYLTACKAMQEKSFRIAYLEKSRIIIQIISLSRRPKRISEQAQAALIQPLLDLYK